MKSFFSYFLWLMYPLRNTALFLAHLRESWPLCYPLLAPLNTLEPQPSTPPLFLLPPKIPSAAMQNMSMPPRHFRCTTLIPSAHCFGTPPLACSTPPADARDLPLVVLVPCCTPPYTMMVSDALLDTFMHYSRLHHIFALPTESFQAADRFDVHECNAGLAQLCTVQYCYCSLMQRFRSLETARSPLTVGQQQ